MQNSLVTIRLMDVVSGKATAADGINLFFQLEKAVSSNQKIRLSLAKATPFSTSFLNTSFGDLADKYGLDVLRALIVFTDITPSQVKKMKSYFEQLGSLV
jgi:hypothetical protein